MDKETYLSIAAIILAIITLAYTYKSVKLTKNKNDYELWYSLSKNLKEIKNNKILRSLLIPSISFLKKLYIGQAYVISEIAIKHNISLSDIRRLSFLSKRKLLSFRKTENNINISFSSKCKNKFSMLFFSTAKGFKYTSWLIFILFHAYIVYTFIFYGIDLFPYKSTYNIPGIIYVVFLILTEWKMLSEIEIRNDIEYFNKKTFIYHKEK